MLNLCRECKFVIVQPGFWDNLCDRSPAAGSCETERTNEALCGQVGKFWKQKENDNDTTSH